jgi:hypothetical protein
MRFQKLIGGLCGLTMLTGVGAVASVAVPSGGGPPLPPAVQGLDVDPDPSTVGQTVTISNEDEDGRCPPWEDVGPLSEHEDSQFYVELTIEPPTGDPTTVHAATEPGEDWEVEYTSDEVGVHDITGECVDRFGGIFVREFAAGPDLLAGAEQPGPRVIHFYEGSFTVEAEDETTTTSTPTPPTTPTTPTTTTTTTTTVPGPAANGRTPSAPVAAATPTFVG